MTDTIQEEATTLPEGATVSASKMKSAGEKRTVFFTELRAYRHGNDNIIKMRIDDVGPVNLRQYLDLICREITRRRASYTAKPTVGMARPQSMADFVQEMAYQEMFIFNALSIDPFDNPECAELKKENGKQRDATKPKRKPRATKPKRDKRVPGAVPAASG